MFIAIEKAIDEIKQGKMLILVDNEKRENEGDLIIAAEKVTPEAINFMVKYGRGLICLPMTAQDLNRLQVPLMVDTKPTKFQPAFTVSIEAAQGVTSGMSAHDRYTTIKAAINPQATRDDIVMPGHMFPLKAQENGVLDRAGHTEGSIDLMKLASLHPSAVICEVLNDDGTMARGEDLIRFAKEHQISMLSIDDVIQHRMNNENLIAEITTTKLPTKDFGDFAIKVFEDTIDHSHHIALIKGELDPSKPTLVRVHSECLTGDIFSSNRCDCGWQLEASLQTISERGGVLLYMRQEGRGIGLANKLKAYALQDEGLDTVQANHELGFPADPRDYGIAVQILRKLEITKINLLTNNPKKITGLTSYGIDVVAREALIAKSNQDNVSYLKTKQEKLGHLLQEI